MWNKFLNWLNTNKFLNKSAVILGDLMTRPKKEETYLVNIMFKSGEQRDIHVKSFTVTRNADNTLKAAKWEFVEPGQQMLYICLDEIVCITSQPY